MTSVPSYQNSGERGAPVSFIYLRCAAKQSPSVSEGRGAHGKVVAVRLGDYYDEVDGTGTKSLATVAKYSPWCRGQ